VLRVLLTLSIAVRVSPEPEAVELPRRYRIALNYAINRILSQDLKTIRDAHRKLYRELIERFGLSSRIALDCYRDALANAKAWKRNREVLNRIRSYHRKAGNILETGLGRHR
jgi:hypothetical protein